MRRFLFLAPLFAALVACSSVTDTDDAHASDDDLVAGGVCSTLDYGPRGDASEIYRFYATNGEVTTSVQQLLATGALAPLIGSQGTVAGVDSDERAVRLVREVFDGYKKAFPVETAGLDHAPPVVIMQSPIANAFALGSSVSETGAITAKSPWFFCVNTGLLTHGNTDDEVSGVIAHELGHLILQTFKPDVQARVRHAYKLGTGSEDGVLGASQQDDAEIGPQVGRLLLGQTRVGAISQLGVNFIAPGVYTNVMRSMLIPTPATQAVCTSAIQRLNALIQKQIGFLPGLASQDLVPKLPNAKEQAELEALSAAAITDVTACAAPNASEVGPVGAISALLQGLPPEAATDPSSPAFAQIQAGMHPLERDVDAAMPTATFFARVVRAESLVRNDIVNIRSSIDMSRVRVYDYEEDADDASMRVLHAIGKDPHGIGGFTLSVMAPAAKAACIADVAAGKPIAFGEAYDVHPASCWRYYHSQQFSKALGTCQPMAAKRGPLKTSLPVLANDPATVSGILQR